MLLMSRIVSCQLQNRTVRLLRGSDCTRTNLDKKFSQTHNLIQILQKYSLNRNTNPTRNPLSKVIDPQFNSGNIIYHNMSTIS